MRLFQEDLRHFETLVQATEPIHSHANGLSKKHCLQSDPDDSTPTRKQIQQPKRRKSNTHGTDTPSASHVDRYSAAVEEQSPGRRHEVNENQTSEYHIANRSSSDAIEGLSASNITASNGQDAVASAPAKSRPHLPSTGSQRSHTSNMVPDNDAMMTTALPPPSRYQSTANSPQQSQRTSPQVQKPSADLQQPGPLDLQREYSIVREHVSRKDIASGLPAIASIAALRSCMADLKDAVKMNSEAWFSIVREKLTRS